MEATAGAAMYICTLGLQSVLNANNIEVFIIQFHYFCFKIFEYLDYLVLVVLTSK